MRQWGLVLLCGFMLVSMGCNKEPEPQTPPEPSPSAALPLAQNTQAPKKQQLIGYIVEDDRTMPAALSMQGFLHMAENLGYPAKLYRAKPGAEAAAAVDTAVEDGCKGLLIQNAGGANDEAVRASIAAGMQTAVPFDRCGVEGLQANVVADEGEYVEEITRGIAARMTERSLKTGLILLYGNDPQSGYAAFSSAVEAHYPQYDAVAFQKTGATEEDAVAELAEFLLYNRNIKGMYVMDTGLAATAVKARARAISRFNTEGTPSPSPTPEPLPGATPAPTIAPGLLTQISVTVFACGLSEENIALFNDNDIYALCIEPYYEASARAAMVLDQLLSGEQVAKVSYVNRPIANADTIDKYLAIYQQTKEMFGL